MPPNMTPDELADRAEEAFTELTGLAEEVRMAARAHLVTQHAPSKAAAVLGGGRTDSLAEEDRFFLAVSLARSPDAEAQRAGKAMLEQMGSTFVESHGKAVLGDTDGSGGYIVPKIVAEAIEGTVAASSVRDLLNVIPLRVGAGVEMPIESGPGPERAVVVGRGQTKPNVDLTLANYTATMYTLAQIIDAGNQWLRQTGGGGEKLIRSRLGRAFVRGENYYILEGSGSSEPNGLLTALAAAPASMTTAHTASDSTVAGSIRAAVAKAIEALARRGREADGVLFNTGDLAHAGVQGADNAGFWTSGGLGDFGLPGVRVRATADMPSGSAIVGEWRGAELYVGDEYRVDTSTEAGDRWDKNLTGFRGEEEIGFNAEPYVLAGRFQRITGLIP